MHGNTRLEIAWTVVPVLIVAAIAALVFYELPGIADVPPATAAGGREDVRVVGYRFYWQFEYPERGDRRRPDARPGRHERETRRDGAGLGRDPLLVDPASSAARSTRSPARVNHTWFNAQRAGVFNGQCAELCGIYHAKMTASVEALPRAEYDAWLEERARGVGLGEETFVGACAKCHGLAGEGDIGPPARGHGARRGPGGGRAIVRNGRGEMPPLGRDWSDRQMDALTEYLREELGGGTG